MNRRRIPGKPFRRAPERHFRAPSRPFPFRRVAIAKGSVCLCATNQLPQVGHAIRRCINILARGRGPYRSPVAGSRRRRLRGLVIVCARSSSLATGSSSRGLGGACERKGPLRFTRRFGLWGRWGKKIIWRVCHIYFLTIVFLILKLKSGSNFKNYESIVNICIYSSTCKQFFFLVRMLNAHSKVN
jgi:hypothetical protein